MSGVELYGLFIGQSAFTASYWERLSPATKTAWEVLARKLERREQDAIARAAVARRDETS